MLALRQALLTIVGPDGLLDAVDIAQRSAGAFRDDALQAGLLVRPRSTDEVAQVLRLCHAHGQSVVPQGGRTGLVHGSDARPDQLILSLERMNRIEQIDPLQRIAVVQAGVVLQALQDAVAEQDLFFPLDLGARGSATLGGNVATNAGGNRVIRYGMTRDLVLGVEAVLANGSVLSSLNRMIKNNAGYDLKQLFIGTEGGLGVVTRVVLRLLERPRSQNLALLAVDRFEQVIALLKYFDRALGGALSAFEVMWSDFYELVTRPPAKGSAPLPHGHGWYVLVESQGGDIARDGQVFQDVLAAALEDGLLADAVIAASERERTALWSLRDDVLQTNRHGTAYMFDVSLPVAEMERYVHDAHAALRARWPDVHLWTFGHLGDGNLHFAVRPPGTDQEARPEVEEILYRPLAAFGGSVSAEHGIGEEKRRYLDISRSAAEIAAMRVLKQALDPKGILNPGKVLADD
ncbi:FAD-linked oxidase [Xanthomonas hyacinthi DSM 19077]|nr:FAD-linked oxidase [Xanthomonas hyacinthi DSM 19077]